jgi:hypothetical protein
MFYVLTVPFGIARGRELENVFFLVLLSIEILHQRSVIFYFLLQFDLYIHVIQWCKVYSGGLGGRSWNLLSDDKVKKFYTGRSLSGILL